MVSRVDTSVASSKGCSRNRHSQKLESIDGVRTTVPEPTTHKQVSVDSPIQVLLYVGATGC